VQGLEANITQQSNTARSGLLSHSGIDRITPLPVPTHRRLDATNRQLIRTKEKPRLPVPEQPVHTVIHSWQQTANFVFWRLSS